ncbi:hypothetical protein LJB89_01620 [Tyzzerella sp. OttesenSCG-928-J15]|nr:hypothetical protein [Tyzzerella sp. OttesenSCG-928-J15]
MKKMPYKRQALSYGDYSYMLPACPEYGIQRDLYFTGRLCIERKAHLEELSGNLGQKREQFENEFRRAGNAKIIIMIERGNLSDIYYHKYRTELSEKAYIASVMAFRYRYDIDVDFIDIGNAGAFIYQNCYYQCREYLKGQ